MALVVNHNISSIQILNQLQDNSNELGKKLKQLSSGMKVNSAGDAAAEFAISEKMRTQIRSLGQDKVNVDNGYDMLNIASGGMDNIVSVLRTMKELTINAANDTNTDEDRAIIQKEINQRINTIEDIASTTSYNGKLLLNGDYYPPYDYQEYIQVKIGETQKTIHIGPPSVTVTQQTDRSGNPVSIITQDNQVNNLTAGFKPVNGQTYSDTTKKAYDGTICAEVFLARSNPIAVEMDFSLAVDKSTGVAPSYPDDLDGQGFTILCTGCRQFLNFKFDASTDSSSAYFPTDSLKGEYTVGIRSVNNADELKEAIFQAVVDANGGTALGDGNYKIDVQNDKHNVRIGKNEDGKYYIFKDSTSLGLCFFDEGRYLSTSINKPGEGGVPSAGQTIVNLGYDETITEPVYKEELQDMHDPGRPLIIHDGTKSTQHIKLYIKDMHPKAIGVDPLSVRTRDDASASIDVVDTAVQAVLDEVTRIGAYQNRLRIDGNNLQIANENTTAAESVLRDADMAKSMTEYTKNNVLVQAAQAMLAQSNQNPEAVLSLLK